MEIEVRLFGPFREAVGEERLTASVAEDATCRDLLERLETTYPTLDGRLLDTDGDGLAGQTVITRNKTDVRHRGEGLETRLSTGDVIRAIPSVYGG